MRNTLCAAVTLLVMTVAGTAMAAPKASKQVEDFRRGVSGRVEAVWSKIEKKLETRGVSAERRKALRLTFDEAALPIFTEIDRAGADGTISREESSRIGIMTTGLRGKFRGKLATARSEAKKAEERDPEADRAPARPPTADKSGAKKGDSAKHDGGKGTSPAKGDAAKGSKGKGKDTKAKGKAQHQAAAAEDAEE